jgi:hypothetical protein
MGMPGQGPASGGMRPPMPGFMPPGPPMARPAMPGGMPGAPGAWEQCRCSASALVVKECVITGTHATLQKGVMDLIACMVTTAAERAASALVVSKQHTSHCCSVTVLQTEL